MVEIKFSAINKTDLPKILEWRNSPNVLPYCRQYRPLSLKDMEVWYDRLRDGDYNLSSDLHIISHDNIEVGVGGLVRIDWRNRKGEVSFYIADVENCTEEVIGECLLSIMEYSFKTLNLHKIYWPVYQFNPYLQIYEKYMKREYVAKKEYYWDGEYHDRIVLVAYANDWR